MISKRPLTLAGLAVASTFWACTPSTTPPPRAVETAEQAAVVGGVSTQVQWPTQANWSQSYDNLRFQIAVDNGFGTSSISLIAGADGTKVGNAYVPTTGPGSTGTWHTRMNWPFPGPKQLQLQYVNPNTGQTFSTVGQPTLSGQALLPDVKVHTVKFWNAVSPSMSTNVSSAISRALVDNLNAAIPTRTTNVDGIYAENCPVGTKTQWRFAGIGTLSISDACMDMVASGVSNTSCIPEFYSNYDTDPNTVHVVYIKRNQTSGWAGAHLKSGASYSITIRDDWEGNADLDALLAHEMGHTYVGGHVTSPTADCTLPRANRNLMCSNVGRVMNATQCATAASSSRYVDRN